jgi:hypothetical protein
VRLGFDRTKLVESIRTRQQNEATVTYWLLLDNRRRMPSSGYLAHELSEAVAAASAGYLGATAGELWCLLPKTPSLPPTPQPHPPSPLNPPTHTVPPTKPHTSYSLHPSGLRAGTWHMNSARQSQQHPQATWEQQQVRGRPFSCNTSPSTYLPTLSRHITSDAEQHVGSSRHTC